MENMQLRDVFSRNTIEIIANSIFTAWSGFDRNSFIKNCLDGLFDLSFGDRAKRIVTVLHEYLPANFEYAVSILTQSLGPELKGDEFSGFDGFYIMPLAGYISKYGIEFPNLALPALYEMTKRFSAEGDIRAFIERYPKKTYAFLESLVADPSPFARRLASEGTRPRLPLASRLRAYQRDPTPVIRLLDRLYTDANLMVRRSVANNINDITKDNSEIAVDTLARWKQENPSAELDWIVRHGLRTLIKQDDPAALSLLGFDGHDFDLEGFSINRARIALGEDLTFRITIRSRGDRRQKLALNYVVFFVKANGRCRPKVFRLPKKEIEAGESIVIEKTHRFRPFRNQTFHSGVHSLEVRVNGVSSGTKEFELVL